VSGSMQIYSQDLKIRADAAALRTILSVTKWFVIDITIRGQGNRLGTGTSCCPEFGT
jgi:hypothetical protein